MRGRLLDITLSCSAHSCAHYGAGFALPLIRRAKTRQGDCRGLAAVAPLVESDLGYYSKIVGREVKGKEQGIKMGRHSHGHPCFFQSPFHRHVDCNSGETAPRLHPVIILLYEICFSEQPFECLYDCIPASDKGIRDK